MKIVKQYKSEDGQLFNDRFECARHEFNVKPELLGKINAAMNGRHLEEKGRWCGGDPDSDSYYSSACGCMGCANHAFYKLGLSYEHWKVWFEELRVMQPGDNIPNTHTDVDVIIVLFPEDRIIAFKAIREITGLGVLETKNLMDKGPGVMIRRAVDYYDGTRCVELLKEAGVQADLVVSDTQSKD